jgi:hypothetical protein
VFVTHRLLISIVGCFCAYGAANAQPFVEHIAPPLAERGKTTRVEFVGGNLGNAVDVWHSLPADAIRAKVVESKSDRAIFDLQAAKDAPVGVCGLRVATRDGLSNVHLFVIDDLPVRNASGKKLTIPAAIWGTFREATVDRYEIAVPIGRLSFEIIGNRFGKDADPLITIRDAHGKIVAEHDNDPGLYFDSRFEHDFREAGTYTIEVRDARFHGSEHFQYVLRVGKFPANRVAMPSAEKANRLPGPYFAAIKRSGDDGSSWVPMIATTDEITIAGEPSESRTKAFAMATSPATTFGFNLSPLRANPFLSVDALLSSGHSQATFAKVPGVLCGTLRRPGERQAFLFELAKGQQISVRGEAKSLNSPADLEVVLTDRFGRELRRGTEAGDQSRLDFTASAAGHYGLVVRDQLRDGGEAFAYRLTIANGPLPPTLVAEVEGLTIPQGSYQPIPIEVTRTGTTGPIKLTLLGAPPGLTLSPNIIDEKEPSVVCRLEASSSTPLGLHTIQILAETQTSRFLVQTQPLIDKQLINVDLIPITLREDQKRLPPSVTDRLGVQITPPAPFTMELPEKSITLPRYQRANIPIVTTRIAGFDGPIAFNAKGGQLADRNEGRTRVYADFPDATASARNVNGAIVSKILSNLGKTRIEVSGTGVHDGRRITLTRTFELNLTTAFAIAAEPVKLSLLPGEAAKVRVVANRVKTFDGEVAIQLPTMNGLQMPERVIVQKGQSSAEIEVRATADAQPGQHNVQLYATAQVDGFEEEQRGNLLTVEVRKVEPPKKK